MHLLSSQNRSEFLACPQLIRFDYAQGQESFEPTLLIKGSTLLLKYIVLGAKMQLAFANCEGRLLYVLKVHDDGKNSGAIWSIAEREEEMKGLRGLARGESLVAFLFNELAVNVAWNDLPLSGKFDRLSIWANDGALGHVDYRAFKALVEPMIDRLQNLAASNDEWLILDIAGRNDWKALYNHLVRAHAPASIIDLFDRNEGKQQENLAVWLTDKLQPFGVHHSPEVPKGTGTRELIDVMMSHEFGTIIIESKTLSVLTRTRLPDRTKLTRDVTGHIRTAFSQLSGAIRKLKSGVPVTDSSGLLLEVERQHPVHAIALVPELSLVDDREAYGIEFMVEFMEATGGFVHLLDIAELLRVVQAAEMIAAQSNAVTLMMAFDYYLIERAKKASEAGTLCINVLLRFDDDLEK